MGSMDPLRMAWTNHLLHASMTDREIRRMASAVALTAVFSSCMSVLGIIILETLEMSRVATVAQSCMVGGFLASLVVLRRSRTHRSAAIVIALSILFGCLVTAAGLGGIRSPHLLIVGLAVLSGGFLVGRRFGLLCAALSAAGVTVLYVLDVRGVSFGSAPLSSVALLMANLIHLISVAAVVALYDVSRRRAVAQLGATRANLQALVANTGDAIWSVDRPLRLVTFNAAFEQRFGAGGQTRAGQLVEQYMPRPENWALDYQRALAGEHFVLERTEIIGGSAADLEIAFNPIRRERAVTGVTVFVRDITDRKRQERKLAELRRDLVTASRMAGMAEVATSILHNIGNTLNSLDVSAGLAADGVRRLRIAGLRRSSELLAGLASQRSDPALAKLADYLRQLGDTLEVDLREVVDELERVRRKAHEIAGTVASQQSFAKIVKVAEPVDMNEVVEAAERLGLARVPSCRADVVRSIASLPTLVLDRDKTIWIVMNLVSNAAQAIERADVADGRVGIAVSACAPDRLRLEVTDNGIGIAVADQAGIFSAHGFGLHWSALAAQEMRGSLTCSSEGPGRGASFRLELPLVLAGATSVEDRA